ncbi:hypothetical protein NQ314_020484 [Rhamnusium bicolor]|uniref:Uncharacterized protein n=1 Tax=Rhamnusium bicolor TaxID=1586634 RepID=A0AAV8WKF8_9CUCU|nr:hypothetical protein NQ314_020484 [Rhamnusium bicolor]
MAPSVVVREGVKVVTALLIQELRKIIRNQYGVSETLLKELALEDKEGYKNHLRMSEEKFEQLLVKIGPKIQKQDTLMRKALPATLKLQITLRYLATGDSFATLAFMYRVPKNTIFIKEVCKEIYEALQEFIKAYFFTNK